MKYIHGVICPNKHGVYTITGKLCRLCPRKWYRADCSVGSMGVFTEISGEDWRTLSTWNRPPLAKPDLLSMGLVWYNGIVISKEIEKSIPIDPHSDLMTAYFCVSVLCSVKPLQSRNDEHCLMRCYLVTPSMFLPFQYGLSYDNSKNHSGETDAQRPASGASFWISWSWEVARKIQDFSGFPQGVNCVNSISQRRHSVLVLTVLSVNDNYMCYGQKMDTYLITFIIYIYITYCIIIQLYTHIIPYWGMAISPLIGNLQYSLTHKKQFRSWMHEITQWCSQSYTIHGPIWSTWDSTGNGKSTMD